MSRTKKIRPKPPKITDFSRALLEQVKNHDITRERVDRIEGLVQAICDHLGLKPVLDEPEEPKGDLVPFAAAGEAVPSEGA
jgi:hypothetical protein